MGHPPKWTFKQESHVSDDETVAKMGHPDLDVGHPSNNTQRFSPKPQLEKYPYSSSAHAMIRSDPELPGWSEI
jgi:hypothetical protein